MKKGQITLFLILGIIIICIVLLYIFILNNKINLESKKEPVLESQSIMISDIVNQCLSTSFLEVSKQNALNGGYYLPIGSETYYFLNNSIIYPSKEELTKQLSLGIREELAKCLNSSDFKINIKYDLNKANLQIYLYETYSEVTLNMPITISIGEVSSKIDHFYSKTKTDYLKFYKIATSLTDEQSKHPNELCISCIDDLSKKNSIYIESLEKENSSSYEVMYIISDSKNFFNNETTFIFNHKFDLTETK